MRELFVPKEVTKATHKDKKNEGAREREREREKRVRWGKDRKKIATRFAKPRRG